LPIADWLIEVGLCYEGSFEKLLNSIPVAIGNWQSEIGNS